MHDCMDAGGRATQDAKAEELLSRTTQDAKAESGIKQELANMNN